MSSTLVFCTADLEPRVIENFLLQSGRFRQGPQQMWLLVRSPEEGVHSPAIGKAKEWFPEENAAFPDCPVIEAFSTGFKNWSVSELGRYAQEVEVGNDVPAEDRPTIDGLSFVVLDERSALDGTALVYHLHERLPPEIFKTDPEADETGDYDHLMIKEWVEWRLKFQHTTFWILWWSQNAGGYGEWQIDSSKYFDENGVFQFPGNERTSMLAEYPNELKAPWGPKVESSENEYFESGWLDAVNKGLIKVYPVIGSLDMHEQIDA